MEEKLRLWGWVKIELVVISYRKRFYGQVKHLLSRIGDSLF